MKLSRGAVIIFIAVIFALFVGICSLHSQTTNETDVTVLERGANHNLVQHIVYQTNAVGEVTARTNSYTELATGLNYQDNGQWKESKAEIEILNNGTGAVGTNTGHKVSFKPNLDANGVMEITTPDGKVLRSQILGLGYYDRVTRQSEIIAVIKDAEGELHGDNEVVYPDAFTGVDADVRFRYTRAGIEQDVILRSQPPKPQDFGLNITNTHLEVFTEFVNPPTPEVTTTQIKGTTLFDDRLKFGKMVMGRGRAFPVGEENSRRRSVPTGKTWVQFDDRHVLVEGVEYKAVKKDLDTLPKLPRTAALTKIPKSFLASNGRKIPGKLTASATPSKARFKKQARLAGEPPKQRDGFVLDYIAVQEWEETEAVFESGQTYFISAGFWPYTLTIQAGAVVKFADDPEYGGWGHTLVGNGVLHCPPSGFATLTSMHDDTIGETIDESTGQPDPDVAAVYLELGNGPARVHNLIFKYALAGVVGGAATDNRIYDCQFLSCESGVLGFMEVGLTNVVFSDCYSCVDNIWDNTCNVKGSRVNDLTGSTFLNLDSSQSYSAVKLKLDRCCVGSPATTQELLILGQAITTAGGTFSWTRPCSPYDTDQDGLLDAWEIQHFGNLNQTDTADYDGDGVSNNDEHQAGTDPNTIKFDASYPRRQVNTTTATGNVRLQYGVPLQMAVLVDSVNYASAIWQPYQPIFSVNLGNSDGKHVVRIATRGRNPNAPVKWVEDRITLDRVAPTISITNPIISTTSRPVLQLQGFSDERLASLTYDIANAFGSVSGKRGFVVDQHFDASRFDFTTNYFQCYDIPLANGQNTITVRATDLAGNTKTLVKNVSLDLAADTAPPSIQVNWPQNGMSISGDSFYVRGKLDDGTAKLTGSIVAGGNTAEFTGVVERDGRFWITNLPLAVGNNIWGCPR